MSFINSQKQLYVAPRRFLILETPAPILNQISEGAFRSQRYASRLLINDVETDFVRATIDAPRKSMGKSISVELGSGQLSQLSPGASFKFQIRKKTNGVFAWRTVLDGARLAGSNFSMSPARNSLSFSTLEPLNDKLGKCPKNNLIVFDGNKLSVSTADVAPVPISGGGYITTTARDVRLLTLYKLLDIAFVEGCGFSSVETDIPNYEIKRCNFGVNQSYSDAVAPFIGRYEPEFAVNNNVLTIFNTTKRLPVSFAPRAIYANQYPRFTRSSSAQIAQIDGYTLLYSSPGSSYSVDRNLPDIIEPSGGEYGDAGFVETTIKRTMRDWFTSDGALIKSELKSETREKRRGALLTGKETNTNKFDRAGRPTGYAKTVETRLPDVDNNGAPSLLLTRENVQKITYATNPFAPLRTIQSRIETSSSALLAVDSENTALDSEGNDSPFKEDYERVFGNGNLKKEMTSEFALSEMTTETFRPLASGQVEVRVESYNFLRDKPNPSQTDVRSGDISVSDSERPLALVIFKDGLTQGNRPGKPLPTFPANELPLRFAETLVRDILAAPERSEASIEIAGYDESIERGVIFNLRGRSAEEDLGNYLTLGFKTVIEPAKIMTTIDALKVETEAA